MDELLSAVKWWDWDWESGMRSDGRGYDTAAVGLLIACTSSERTLQLMVVAARLASTQTSLIINVVDIVTKSWPGYSRDSLAY